MPYEVRIAARAQTDIEEATAWLVRQSPSAASRWYETLLTSIQTLESNPERCPTAHEAEDLAIDLRQLLFGKRRGVYRILFVIQGNVVNVLHVRHSARDWLRPEDVEGATS
jgi:plasmid stabilization system protein ParE